MVKERAAFIIGYQKRSLEYLLLKKSKLSDGFQGRLFKSTVKERVQGV